MLAGPKYDGNYLHSILRQYLGQSKLHDTLTNVVIPTFDVQILQPTIFSNFTVLNTNLLLKSVPFSVTFALFAVCIFSELCCIAELPIDKDFNCIL